MATDAEAIAAGFVLPTGTDPIRTGDDDITHNAKAAVDLYNALDVPGAIDAAERAEAAAALAEDISGIAVSDDVVATEVNNPASDTTAALLAHFQRKLSIYPVLAADGATDDAPALAAAIAAGAAAGNPVVVVNLPAGNIRLNSPIYLDSASNDLTYVLRGQGTATKLTLGPGLDGTYALFVNQTSGAAVPIASPSHPRLVVEHLLVDGAASTSASFVWFNSASCVFDRVRFRSLMYGATGTGYADHMTFRNCHVQTLKAGGWMYYQQDSGDGLVLDSVNGGINSQVARIYHCSGAVLRGGISGRYEFNRSRGVEVIGDHHDSLIGVSGEQGVAFTVKESYVAFRGCWNHNGPTQPWVQIDDSLSVNQDGSEVLFDKCVFAHRLDTTGDARSADVDVLDSNASTRLRFSSCRGALWVAGTYTFDPAGVRVTATGDAALQAVLDTWGHLLSSGDAVVYQQDGSWQITPPPPAHQLKSLVKAAAAPAISSTAVTANPAGTLANGTTYYYKLAIFDGVMWSQESAEVSRVTTAAGQAIQLNISPKIGPVKLRVWRGTATGVYTRYVDIPLGSGAVTRLWDQGAYLGGYAWITTGVPATPGATNAMLDGTILAGRKIVYRSAAPTAGTWAVGDLVLNPAPAASGFIGWVCVTAGTPGTWKTWGAISA